MSEREDNEAWFAPKRFGYGAGAPIRWQGWVALLSYIFAVAFVVWFGPNYLATAQSFIFTYGCIGVLTTLLVLVARAKTRGGWRWRWGDDD